MSRRLIRAIAVIASVIALTMIGAAAARADSAPPAPGTGWTTVFDDDFAGAAGSAPSYNWMYDTGPGSSFGTGEIETMTNSSSNVYLDGNGHLDITALDNGGSWTSGRIQTTSPNVGAPAGGELEVTASIQQPQSDGALYNTQSGKCLDDTGWSTTWGTQVEIWDCTGNANQQWNLP
jgi:Ricin-type beta-trefoil lectin domain